MVTVARDARQFSATPKRPYRETDAAVDIYPYYAGYSYEWALGQLAAANVSDGVVLDPWNGSGTSTVAASRLQIRSVGVELSPVPSIVAEARIARQTDIQDLELPVSGEVGPKNSEPLHLWFDVPSAIRIRAWADAASLLPRFSSAVTYVAIFRAVKRLTKGFEGSNPTWIRGSRDDSERLSVADAAIDAAVIGERRAVCDALCASEQDAKPVLVRASATALPLKSDSIQHVLGSPPYLTRLDYAVAYARELAVLGVDNRKSTLRSDLMGTTQIRKNVEWDAELQRFPGPVKLVVESIRTHSSKESGGYYLKQASQYFSDLIRSLNELTRVAAMGGSLDIVLQDSYYKDIHVPLAEICQEILSKMGWETVGLASVPSPRLLTTLNRSAWRNSKGDINESVLSMVKKW